MHGAQGVPHTTVRVRRAQPRAVGLHLNFNLNRLSGR